MDYAALAARLRSVPVQACKLAVLALALFAGCSERSGPSAGRWEVWTADPAFSGGAAPPCEDGTVRCCAATLGSHNGVTSCVAGTQLCSGGVYGPCAADTVTVESQGPSAASFPGMTVASVSSAQSCLDNPCDPSCQRFDEAPAGGYSPPQTVLWSILTGSLANLPPGFVNKGMHDASHPPADGPCLTASDCQFDTRCDTATGNCVAWTPGQTNPSCSGMDLTLGPTCNGTIPVCNRGTQQAPAGVEIVVFTGNSSQMQDNLGLCENFQGTVETRCHTLEPIAPGHCIEVTGCALHGTESIVVNPPTPAATQAPFPECNCGDNWTVYSHGGACAPVGQYDSTPLVVKQQYLGLCPPGAKVQWGFLTWNSTTPSNASGAASIQIQAHAADLASDLAADCSDCVTLAQVPSTEPAVCALSGPTPCPVDLYEQLGGMPGGVRDVLELVFTLQATPDHSLLPALQEWKLTYSCPAME